MWLPRLILFVALTGISGQSVAPKTAVQSRQVRGIAQGGTAVSPKQAAGLCRTGQVWLSLVTTDSAGYVVVWGWGPSVDYSGGVPYVSFDVPGGPPVLVFTPAGCTIR